MMRLSGKAQEPLLHAPPFDSRRSARMIVPASLFAFAALLFLQPWVGIPALWSNEHQQHSESSGGVIAQFEWGNITPTQQLIYHPCLDGYQCARLELPMNWNRTDGKGSKIALAVIRLPAKVPVTDPRYGGPILLNPGGPGGSGVNMLLRQGKNIQTIVDSELEPMVDDGPLSASSSKGKYFDIVSFDPRGVNNTSPAFSCFPDSVTRHAWQLQSAAEGILGSSESSFDTLWARSEALGAGCSQMDTTEGDNAEWIGRHMNTAPVVADMVELIERHGEWREHETERLLAGATKAKTDIDTIKLRNRWAKGQEMLLYWGFSYGTVLGSTFAAMQPHRIGRAVIDGVCDVPDYYRGGWLANLQDSDSILDKFCEYCHQAGPESCSFATGSSPADIKSEYEHLLASMKVSPISVPASEMRGPDIITYSDVKSMVMWAFYTPFDKFEQMAQLLADLSHGNGSSFADYKIEGMRLGLECRTSDASSEYCRIPYDGQGEALSSIHCTDGESIDGITKEAFRKYWSTLQGQSENLGDQWTHIRLSCIRWKARPEWRFDGPFTGDTSHPLLFIGNSHDPVTPLRNAYTMARGFSNSTVLQQDSEGHCSLSGPSLCTAKAVRQYFQTGELPPPGTVCDVDERPFQVSVYGGNKILSAEDEILTVALRSLSKDQVIVTPF